MNLNNEMLKRLYQAGKKCLFAKINIPLLPNEPTFDIGRDLDEAAFDCLDIAVENGYTVAALPLIKLCSDPQSYVYNHQKVIELKIKIINDLPKQCQENPEAAFDAGHFYLYETEPQDIKNAKKYFLIGASAENASCIWQLGEIAKNEGELKFAFECYLKAALLGQGEAMYAVAECFEKGIGTLADMSKAIDWYKRCALSNYKAKLQAEERLKQLKQN